eukprot:4467000-Amphidinium_carterae.1
MTNGLEYISPLTSMACFVSTPTFVLRHTVQHHCWPPHAMRSSAAGQQKKDAHRAKTSLQLISAHRL